MPNHNCLQCGKEISDPISRDVLDLCSLECAGLYWDRMTAIVQSWPKLGDSTYSDCNVPPPPFR